VRLHPWELRVLRRNSTSHSERAATT